MATGIKRGHGETERHARLKRLSFLWAQAQGYSACAMEVSLPSCRYRADVAAFRLALKQIGSTAIFECKQALCDLRRDNCQSDASFSKGASAHIIRTCGTAIPYFPNSICLISP